MIANVSPSSKSYDDTHNALKYANRAKEIKSSVSIIGIPLFHNCLLLFHCCDTWAIGIWKPSPSLTFQLKSNVVSLNSHIGQYAVVCEKQRQEVIWSIICRSLTEYLNCRPTPGSILTTISMFLFYKDSTVEEEIAGIWEERGAWGF